MRVILVRFTVSRMMEAKGRSKRQEAKKQKTCTATPAACPLPDIVHKPNPFVTQRFGIQPTMEAGCDLPASVVNRVSLLRLVHDLSVSNRCAIGRQARVDFTDLQTDRVTTSCNDVLGTYWAYWAPRKACPVCPVCAEYDELRRTSGCTGQPPIDSRTRSDAARAYALHRSAGNRSGGSSACLSIPQIWASLIMAVPSLD